MSLNNIGELSPITIQDEFFAVGSEGVLYLTTDKRNMVKLYDQISLQNKQPAYLLEILQAGPKPSDGPIINYFAWINAVIVDTKGDIIGIVMPYAGRSTWMNELIWYRSPKLTMTLPTDQRGSLVGRVESAIQIVSAIRWLTQLGYALPDLSPRDVLINPVEGRAVILGGDELIVPNYMFASTLGTLSYMAPELIIGLQTNVPVFPNARTNRHALAVMVFELLLMHHPLLGGTRLLDAGDPDRDALLQLGQYALYVENPTDRSNPPKGVYLSASMLGGGIQQLFEESFINELFSPNARPQPSEYEAALKQLLADLVPCSNPQCLWGAFPSQNSNRTICPVCNTPRPQPSS